MKIITLDGLKTFLDELLEKIGQEVYSKVESDARFATKDTEAKLQGVRFENASRPGRPLPIVMQVDSPLGVMISGGPLQGYVSNSDARKMYQPKASLMQDVIDELNTDNFNYWKEILDFDPTEGMTQEDCDQLYQPKGDYATKADLAQLGGGAASGTWFAPFGPSAWEVPRGVEVVKITWALETTFFKVNPGAVFRTKIRVTVDSPELWAWTLESAACSPNSDENFASIYDLLSRRSTRDTATSEFAISWSEEINAHAVDHDLTV